MSVYKSKFDTLQFGSEYSLEIMNSNDFPELKSKEEIFSIFSFFSYHNTLNRIESLKVILNPNTVCQHAKRNIKGKLGAICNNQQLYNEIKRGIELGLNECETLFKYRRWNCTNLRKSMKKILMKGEEFIIMYLCTIRSL